MLETSHRPDGKCLVDMSISILICYDGCCLNLPGIGKCHLRLNFKRSHRPDGKMADALASTLACASANASVNSSGYVPQRPSKVPIAPMGKCLDPMGFSHVLRLCLQGGGVRVQGGTVSF